ncbi:MAG: PfkB family carbohydrate kinase [Gemmatimonadetes bacterium]|nr:PfkB family carbohydrate kinase [Gemmatimonadota bacterium]
MSKKGARYDVLAWGEGFLRLSPAGRERFEQAGGFGVTVAGGALETAVGLARLGLRTAWLSVVGDTPLGMKLVNKVREHGVDTEYVVRIPDGRTGLCYTETGSAPRPTLSWYDMDDTAFRSARPGTEDWSSIREAAVFHLDLTAPMLDSANAGRLEAALETARATDSRVSILLDAPDGERLDVEVEKRVRDLVETADILMVTLRALETIWGFDGPMPSAADRARARFVTKNLSVVEHRLPAAGAGDLCGIAVSPSGEVFEDRISGIKAIDPDGVPGAFAAGYLLGCLQDCTRSALRYGNAAAALACSIPGPLN